MISGSRRKRKRRSHRSHPQSSPSTHFHGSSSYPTGTQIPYDHRMIEVDNESTNDTTITNPDPLIALYIQAYEADIIRGSHAQTAAQSLEVVEYSTPPTRTIIPKIGSALIRWGGSIGPQRYGDGEGSKDMLPIAPQEIDSSAIWVDRYDARLLLDTLPNPTHNVPTGQQPDSPTGWSDLPSDTEDTFFFTPDESEDFRREKRRRLLERTRGERLKARMEEDHVEDEENQEEEDVWGGSDEEPDDPQLELMGRTATHLLSSPNPAQLEMRILANFGSDKRFAFLRGRWSKKWNLIKVKTRLETERNKEKEESDVMMEKNPAGLSLGLVTGYGSDDSERDDDMEESGSISKGKNAAHNQPELPDTTTVEEVAKEARRKRAKEWAEKRREMKSMKFKGDTT